MKIKINFSIFWGSLIYLSIGSSSFAGQMYVYKNENTGTTLLTNKKSHDQSLTTVKITYYPESNIHRYSNWGTSEASVLPSYNKNKNAFDHIIQRAAHRHGISEALIKAVMHTESGFNIRAKSPVGAQGLMQLMPATARRFKVSNAYDPEQNIMAGAEYLAWLLRRFNGNTQLALAGYNAGEGNVAKYGGIPPFKETQDYVQRVLSRYNNLYIPNAGAISTASSNSSIQNITPSSTQQRQIIIAADGTYTDKPANTYSTQNAVASARIYISE